MSDMRHGDEGGAVMTQCGLFDQPAEVPDAHYNTTGMGGEELAAAKQRCKTQNQMILDLFSMNPRMTPSICCKFAAVRGHNWPVTSIRRAMTDLTEAGYLRKTDRMVPGDYGAKEHVWEVIRAD